MTKTIKRAVVLRALRTEPLTSRCYFQSNAKLEYPKNCKVCAVGAVLRHASFEKWAREHGYDIDVMAAESLGCDVDGSDMDIDALLARHNWLGALSNYFELHVDRHGLKKARKDSIAFVKEYFPKQFDLTIESLDC